MTEDRVLGLFAKWPAAGQVKTRLASTTSVEWATQVAAAFLADTLDRLAVVPAHRFIVYTPDDAALAFASLAEDRFSLLPQGSGHLGDRLARFFAAHDGLPVVVLGSDSPTLPAALVEAAFGQLEHADVVLGPATDGGYYLLGCRRYYPSLFSGIDWGGCRVLAQTIERLGEASLTLLPPWYDVDSLEDWQMLRGHVAALRRAGIDPGVPRTEKLLLAGR